MALTKVTGHVIKSDTNITSHNINSSGIITAISFDGNVSGVAVTFTGDSTIGSLGITTNLNVGGISTFTGNIDANGDLDVDGHTNLDNVSIAGVTTSQTINFGTNQRANFATNNRFSIHSNGTNSYLDYAGSLNVRGNSGSAAALSFQSNSNVLVTNDLTVSGNSTVSGNLSVGGVLTYQDVTNIDSIGIVTARSDIRGGRNLSVVGISTFSDHINLPDNKQIKFGGSSDFKIEHNTNENYIDSNSGHIYIRANVNDDEGDNIIIQAMSGEDSIKAIHDGAVELYHNGVKQFETGSSGVLLPDMSTNKGRLAFGDFGTRIEGGGGGGADDGLYFMTNSVMKWQMNPDGDLIPNTAGAVDIGSASKEIGNIYIADNKRLYLGTNQSFSAYNDGSGNTIFTDANNFYLKGNSVYIQANQSEPSAYFLYNGAVKLYYDGGTYSTPKLQTTATGISVHGEVAASQDYPNFRPSLNFNFAGEKKLEPRVTYERTGPASFTDEFGKVVIVGDNAPRFDHDPDTKESLGLLIEPKKTNLWLYSEDLATYVQGGFLQQATLADTTATTDPTGGTNAVKMAATATGGAHSFYKNFTNGSNGDIHTASVWVKSAGVDYARIYIDTVGGNLGGSGITFSTGNTWTTAANGSGTTTRTSAVKYPNGWWRLSVTGSFSSQNQYYVHIDIEGGEGDIGYTGNGTDGIYVWGVQFESSTQSYVTSYIPTYGTAVTRGDDIVKLDGEDFTDFYNQEEGTLVSEFKIFDRIQSSAAIANINALSSSSYADSIMFMEVGHTSGYFGRVYKNSNGISLNGSSDLSSIVQNGNQTNKVSFGWSATSVNQGLAAYLNGTLQEESTDESRTPTNMTELRIGTGWQQNSSENQTWAIHAHVKKLMYYPKRLSNNQLATLTS